MPDTAFRILYVDPLANAVGAAAADAAAQGFTHILVSPPWAPSLSKAGAGADRYVPSAIDPAALAPLAQAAKRAGVALLVDLQVNRVAAGAGEAWGRGLFAAPDASATMDPRHGVDLDADIADPANAGEAQALGVFWGGHLSGWMRQGVAGVRLLGLDGLAAPVLGAFLEGLRAQAPTAALLAWTPGMTREAVHALEGHGLAGVFSSFPWWDLRAPWFWEELDVLARAAPVLHAVEAPGFPPGPALAPGDATAESGTGPNQPGQGAYRRSATLAAFLGQGWMASAPAGDFARDLNTLLSENAGLGGRLPILPAGAAAPVLSVLRCDTPDRRQARHVLIALVNTDPVAPRAIDPAAVLAPLGGRFAPLQPRLGGTRELGLEPLILGPSDVLVFVAEATSPVVPVRAKAEDALARAAAAAPRLAIEAVSPAVDGGAFPVKMIAGETVTVTADLLFDGHEKIAGALRWRAPGSSTWQEVAMVALGNDRWQGQFPLDALGRHDYVVCTWRDAYATFADEISKKHAAGVNVTVELAEGIALLGHFAASAPGEIASKLRDIAGQLGQADGATRREILLSPQVAALMAAADPRPFLARTPPMPIDAERIEARFASWYEVFPRSLSDDPARHGTFDDVVRHMPRIAAMGFDVLYFPPIHPIGRKNRKGRNNTLTPAAGDPGSPYAIGNEDGGHDALHPELGDFAAFGRMRAAAAEHGLELAIDFAVQCAPDHPWLREHPGWFDWRPDGTIKYAENPPKKYEDIVNVDFYADGAVPGLWLELCRVVLFWASQGVRLFRVDNPHTKPFPFWEWMIREVRTSYPDAIFLAEAFTRPKIMYRLAKIGFSQSYTYFTWRNTKQELAEYSTELATEAPRDFFRPHFFVNTPDINPVFLQGSGRPGFLIRAGLAATLSGLWGVYNGFELCEAAAVPGREEYLDSEKYQLRAWDWDRPGNIVAEITQLNRLRRENTALQTHLNVRFLNAGNDNILYFEKANADRTNVVLVAISLDPFAPQEAWFEIPLWEWDLPDSGSLAATDLLSGAQFTWQGKAQHLRLTPENPYAIWRIGASRYDV